MANISSEPSTGDPSQRYFSTRGGDHGLSFETVVLKGLAADGGLFLPEEFPVVSDWQRWKDLSYTELAFQIFRLYISTDEIPDSDLKALIDRSYSKFRSPDVTPLVHLKDLHLLELFHGPSYSFKDCALQFLGNLFEYFLLKRNKGKTGEDRYHLTVVGATSGDTGSAAICGLRGKQDVSVFILHPKGRISPCQENQMVTVLDNNVHNLAVKGTFDDCQDIVKALFNDPDINKGLKLGAINSINFSRILAQVVYYFHAYFSLIQKSSIKIGDKVTFTVPTGNHGNILAGYFAKKMGLPVEKLVVATNENDILDRFWKTGRYEKQPVYGSQATGGLPADGVKAHVGGCKETLSPAMDILISSNFERLIWLLAKDSASTQTPDDHQARKQASEQTLSWFLSLKSTGGFGPVPTSILNAGREVFSSDRVSDAETLAAIKTVYQESDYVLDPHTAVGFVAAKRSLAQVEAEGGGGKAQPLISLATAHPAKFAEAVKLALKGEDGGKFDFEGRVETSELAALRGMERRLLEVENSWEGVGGVIREVVGEDIGSKMY